MTEPPPLTSLTEVRRAQAQARFAFLRPVLEEGVPLSRLAREGGIPLRTAQRWLARYRRDGLAGLALQPRSDRGQPRVAHPDLVRLIEGLARQTPPPTAAFVHRGSAQNFRGRSCSIMLPMCGWATGARSGRRERRKRA